MGVCRSLVWNAADEGELEPGVAGDGPGEGEVGDGSGVGFQLLGEEAAEDREGAIGADEAVAGEDAAPEPEAGPCETVSVEVEDQDGGAGDAGELGEEGDDLSIVQMVGEFGGDDEVDGGVGKGEAEGVGAEGVEMGGSGEGEGGGVEVDDEGDGSEAVPGEPGGGFGGEVAGASGDVENADGGALGLGVGGDPEGELPVEDGDSAEELTVDAAEDAVGVGALGGVDAGEVHQLGGITAGGDLEAEGHGGKSRGDVGWRGWWFGVGGQGIGEVCLRVAHGKRGGQSSCRFPACQFRRMEEPGVGGDRSGGERGRLFPPANPDSGGHF